MVIGEAQAVESREPASPSASGRTPEHEVRSLPRIRIQLNAHICLIRIWGSWPHQNQASRKKRRRPVFLCKLAAIGHLPYWKHPVACLFLLFRVACFGGHMFEAGTQALVLRVVVI